ncbi:Clr5 domain-containing protein [Echria macrotheca]|uniref:Clr5 domain-containing protein n=1 Tax=Echria macrotheca TaxID=438768 RepID=A0AAJ0BKC4_9PEZI|nr:Clr5 domain-containing protein [Echria macrotheca]
MDSESLPAGDGGIDSRILILSHGPQFQVEPCTITNQHSLSPVPHDTSTLVLNHQEDGRTDNRLTLAGPAESSFDVYPDTHTSTPYQRGDWESNRATIQNLYLDLNLPLSDVIEIMRNNHCFFATPRMYKRQFTKWGWKKYKADRPAKRTCIRSENERSRLKSSLTLHVQLVDDPLTQHTLCIARDLPSYLGACWVDIEIRDGVFIFMDNFMRPDLQPAHLTASGLFLAGIHNFIHRCPYAGRLHLERSFALIEKILKPCNPNTLIFLNFFVPMALVSYRDTTTASNTGSPGRLAFHMYLKFVAQLASIRLGSHHPMTSVPAALHLVLTGSADPRDHILSFMSRNMPYIGNRVFRVIVSRPNGVEGTDAWYWARSLWIGLTHTLWPSERRLSPSQSNV